MAKADSERYYPDPDDGLPAELVHDWSVQKHARLRRYVDITYKTRAKWPGNTYIDLYCGPGRCCIEETGEFLDGSSMVAARKADEKLPFTEIHIGDMNRKMLEANEKRLATATKTPVHAYLGQADETALQVVKKLKKNHLHLALLDPYSIGALPFSVIRTLASATTLDFIIHVSTMDLQRNFKAMMEDGRLDAFAPGWRQAMPPRLKEPQQRMAVFNHWRDSFASLGHKVRGDVIGVRGDKNQPLYWLVCASRHDIVDKFWNVAAAVSAQGQLQFGSTQ